MDTPKLPGFDILQAMPKGAMGTVYKARQISLDRIVAIKVLPSALAADSADLDQFLAEARITANLKHPNIIQGYDFGKTDEDVYFFVMEFISGYSVGEWIRRKRVLSEENSILVAQSVADALDYAWNADRVIHCDIKPDNIMIDGDGTVKVADLGLARSMRSMVSREQADSGVVCGTPNYISPEQSRGDVELDLRTDIYSLGATLYHCMTGKMPFEGEPLLKVMDLQISDQIPDSQDLNPDISTGAACLIEKMMAKDREDRQQDWKSVQDDFLRIMSGGMPAGPLPEKDGSTIRRSAERDKPPRIKTPMVARPVQESLAGYADSKAFKQMERRFERKQKGRSRLGPKWWLIVISGAAALALGVLAFSSRLARPPLEVLPMIAPEEKYDENDVAEIRPLHERIDFETELARSFKDALKWAANHPDRYGEAIEMFEKVAAAGSGTQYESMARKEIESVRAARRKAVASLINDLEEQAAGLAEDGRYGAAAALFADYEGRLARESARRRREHAEKWRERETAFEEEERAALLRREALTAEVAAALVDGDAASALALVRSAGEEFRDDSIGELKELLQNASRKDGVVLDSFRPQINREVTLELATGPETLTIREVREDHVVAEKIVVLTVGHASRAREIFVNDLAPAEQQKRLGPRDRPEAALMKGLVSIESGDLNSAELFFSEAGPLLSDPLLAEIGKRRDLEKEHNARRAFAWLMRRMGVEVADKIPSPEECMAALRRRTFSSDDLKVLATALGTYNDRFGDTGFAAEYQPVLAVLERRAARYERRPDPAVDDKAPEIEERLEMKDVRRTGFDRTVRENLLNRNPGLSHEEVRFGTDNLGNIVAVEIRSTELRDIAPLAEVQGLRSLICSGRMPWEEHREAAGTARLNNISPLRGMKLEELVLSETDVRDISALAEMPLKRLDLSNTRVHDIRPLVGLQLIELDISGSAVRDIRALQGLPLKQLNISGTSVDNLIPLRGAELVELDASNTRLRDIAVLRGMPLQTLNISDTGVADISMLRGMSLERLDIARTQVRDLGPIDGMPLERLVVDDLNIKDLSVLRGMQLRDLSAVNCGIADISCLAGMPLHTLRIAGTDVADLSVLRAMPLRHLNINFTRVDSLEDLKGLSLRRLSIRGTGVSDLAPLRDMPLRHLDIVQTKVDDIRPIQYLPIENINIDQSLLRPGSRTREPFMTVLRGMPSLRTVNHRHLFEEPYRRRR